MRRDPEDRQSPLSFAEQQAAEFPRVEPGAASRLVGSSFWSLGSLIGYLALAFMVTPVTIRFLGTENYGLLTLVNLVVAYFAFADFGMGMASTKFGAEAYARCDGPGESAAIWTSLLVQMIPMTLVVLLLIFARQGIAGWILRSPGEMRSNAVVALSLAGPLLLFSSLGGIFNTSQVVRLRYGLNGAITLGYNVAQALVTLAIVIHGGGVVAVVLGYTFVTAGFAVAQFIVSGLLCPSFLHPALAKELVKPLFRYGSGVVLTALVGAAIQHGEKLIVAGYLSVRSLAYYNVAFTIAGLLSLFASAVSQPLLPIFAQLRAAGEQRRLDTLYGSVRRGSILAALPLAVAIMVIAKPFLAVWAGAEFRNESLAPLYILTAGAVFHAATFAPRSLLLASGQVGIAPRLHIIELLPYAATVGFLVRSYGILGAALAWSLRVGVECIYFSRAARRLNGIRSGLIPGRPAPYVCVLLTLAVPCSLLACSSTTALLSIFTPVCFAFYAWIVLRHILTNDECRWLLLKSPAPIRTMLLVLLGNQDLA
jgi:O-antigen/teichoic acid export membrane protein